MYCLLSQKIKLFGIALFILNASCAKIMAIFLQVAFVTAAQQMQDSISMSSDGWRPIVGTRRQPAKPESEISHYANPNQGFEVIPAEVANIEATTLPFSQKSSISQKVPFQNSGSFIKERKPGAKVKYSHKPTSPYFMPSGPHQTSISANQSLKKIQAAKKHMMVQSKPRKPIRGQAIAHSSRNEIFVPPPSSNTVPGGFNFVNSGPSSNIRTREAQGFGLLGNNFGISQQNAHIELARFPLTGENILQRPTFFLAKPLQNDEFTRNLVPPPRGRLPQKNKGDTKISLYAFKEGPATDASSSIPQFGPRPNQFVPQISPTYEFSSQRQQKPASQQTKDQAVEVQVTKENLKQYTSNGSPVESLAFGPIPGRNHYPIGYVDYDFKKARPQDSPNRLTYEVTEGKWLDTPSQQYQFRPQDGFFQFQNLRQPQLNARPGLLFQADDSTTPRPPIFQAPLVDLSVPAFLPTPYKPDNGVIPTSPTQSEAATVFAQVSDKMNRYRNNALNDNPLFYDIKEVSTHYPILGIPEAQSEGSTDTPLPINENGEISNDITTTHKGRTRRPSKDPTKTTTTRDPTKARISNRRRPRPKKPSTSTTEEPVVETYEPMISQENIEQAPETERPQRRRRPKPTVYRPQETHSDREREPVETKKHSDEETFNKQRGRYRFRNRERSSTERSDTNVIQRKRLRPTYLENLSKEKQSFEETTETSVEQEQYSFEREPSVHQSYSQEASQSDEAGIAQHTQSQRFETEVPTRHYESTQEQPIRQENKPFIEEIHPITERTEVYEITRAPVTSTTEQESNTHFHVPENEVDYTTNLQVAQDESRNDITTTTSQPTTTVVEAITTKSTRIRRPSKYDSSNRPRFSVKDYRQRLNQYTSTTPSSTTQSKGNSDNLRLRFPSRLRTRPSPTTASSRVDEDVTDETTTTIKSRFRPKDPRHQTTPESDPILTENPVKAINTRIRTFGRPKLTTEATTLPPKVSIRPNLFSARRRTGYPSLKSRIQNKYKNNDTDDENDLETTTSSQNEIEDVEPLNVAETATTEISTSTAANQQTSEQVSTEIVDDSMTEDIIKNDDFMYSQRVSDLTSSFKDYDKPGVFNSVAPTSRSIPNYFTISTDDPILPIEAFFPNLKEKEKMKER